MCLILQKVFLFFLIALTFDGKVPSKPWHDMNNVMNKEHELFMNQYFAVVDMLRSNCLKEQFSLYALSKLELSKLKFSKHHWYFKYLLILSGDINSHPGIRWHKFTPWSCTAPILSFAEVPRKEKWKRRGEKRKGNLCQMPHPGISETRGGANLARYQNEVQSHVLLIFSSQNKFSNGNRNIDTKPEHKSSAKFLTFYKVKCWFG